ncbi:hypothetical protein IAD21_05858 [Abditibacteriota bacterium]|nr:hypothetical protein IAD21_05858 [Abditibacteriota bacterium]
MVFQGERLWLLSEKKAPYTASRFPTSVKRPLIIIFSCLGLPAWAQHAVSVHVLDPNQKPLPNAQVALRIWGEKKWRQETLHTDTTGTATFSLEKPVDPATPVGTVYVHANGFALDGKSINSDSLEFKLQPGAVVRGQVVDGAGHPIADAVIQAGAIRKKDASPQDYLIPEGEELSAYYSTKSAADGTFQLSDLPEGGTVGYSVSKSGFADTADGNQMLVGETAHITLGPEARLHGKLLAIDGKPLAGVRVYASAMPYGEGFGDAKTDANGIYTIGSLRAGEYRVGVDVSDEAIYLVPSLEHAMAQTSQTSELPDLRAKEGVLVSGIVREKATEKPLAGVGITASTPDGSGTDSSSKVTGDDGRFTVRVLPGRHRFYVNQKPQDFLSDEEGQTLDIGATAPALLTFALPKAPLLTGTIVDENNRPIKAQLNLEGSWDGSAITSDAQGHWSWQATTLRPIQVSGGEDENGYFDVVANRQWPVPSPGPIVVKVKRHPWRTLEGRIVSRANKPLAGVSVQATYFVNLGDEGRLKQTTRTATTDTEGHYIFPRIRAADALSQIVNNLKVSASGKGLAFISGGAISQQGDNWMASDIVLSALNRRIEGQTEAGARVVAAGKETTADNAGHFVFEGLPEGEALVSAAANGKFGSILAGDTEAPIKIELSPIHTQGVDVEMGRDAWREVAREGAESKFFALDWVNGQLGVAGTNGETFESLKRTDDGPTTTNGDWSLASKLAKWAPRLPVGNRVARLEEVARGINRPELRLMAWLDSAIQSDDLNVAKRALQEADTALPLAPPEFMWREFNLYRLAVMSEKVEGAKAGEEALNRAIKWTFAHNPEKPYRENGRDVGGDRNDMLRFASDIVAQGSDAMLRQLLANIDPESGQNVWALSEAIPIIARTRGIEAALPLLEELVKMPKPESAEARRLSNFDPQFSFDKAARRLIAPLGEKSPQRALELARRISDSSGRARAIAIAAQFQTPDEAAKLWREAVRDVEVNQAARIAAQAWEHDPKLGAELFALARQKNEVVDPRFGRDSAWPSYAFYFARVDPAAARLELEREWATQLLKTDGDGHGLSKIAMAMSAIDGKRALEMAHAIPKGSDNFWPLETLMKVAQYFITTPEQRRDFPFDRWGATDTWQPGDAEW